MATETGKKKNKPCCCRNDLETNNMKNLFSLAFHIRSLMVGVVLLMGHPVFAQNSIESVNVTPQPGGKIIVRVGLKEPLKSAPAG